jgi:hypothetical protein
VQPQTQSGKTLSFLLGSGFEFEDFGITPIRAPIRMTQGAQPAGGLADWL